MKANTTDVAANKMFSQVHELIEDCWGRIDDLRNQIAAEQAVIDDWKRQIAEIKDFLELARIANPLGGTV